jgi:holo-[acyl-carrier protein] synthase
MQIGTDIVQIDRIGETIAKRILTEREAALFETLRLESRRKEWLAGRFAAKEAVIKAISTNEIVIGPRDVEVLPDADGRPVVFCAKRPDLILAVSIAHEKAYAVAFCVATARNA